MQARFQIRTSRKRPQNLASTTSLGFVRPLPGFTIDSKTLSRLLAPHVPSQLPFVGTFPVIGRERAITEMPANLNVFHPEAARRDL
jgi:hypothetical protein